MFVSCEEKLEKPTPFLDEQTMKEIMYDFSLVSAIEGVSAYYTDTVAKVNGTSVLNKYGIDSLAYAKNSEYYLNLDGGIYLAMQLEVKERLEAEKTVMDSLVNKENEEKAVLKAVADSLAPKAKLLKSISKKIKLDSITQKLN